MTELHYNWNQFNIFPRILNIFSKAESVVLTFEPESITFATLALDSAVGLWAQVSNPFIEALKKTSAETKQQHEFAISHLIQGTKKFLDASTGATKISMKILEDGLELLSKKEKATINVMRIKAMEGECPDFKDLQQGLTLDTWYNISLETQYLINGLSGIDGKVGDVIFSTEPNKKKPSHGSLKVSYKEDFIEYDHWVELPNKTSLQLATKKSISVVKSLIVTIFKDILKHIVQLDGKKSKKRKQEEEAEEEETSRVILRLLENYLGASYEMDGIEIKVYIATIQTEDEADS